MLKLNIFKKKTSDPDRWSVILIKNDIIQYEMASDRVDIMLGYFVGKFSKGNPVSPWKILLRFNKTNQTILLTKDFFPTDRIVKDKLYDEIESIDSGYLVEWYRKPIFIDRINEEIIPISSVSTYMESMDQIINQSDKKSVDFFSILDIVFENIGEI